MNILALKELLRPVVGSLKDHCVDTKIPEFCCSLGLPIPEEGGSKRERMLAAFDALNDSDIPKFAQTLLERRILNIAVRNQTQDLLWDDEPEIEIPKRYRRELARALQPFELFHHWDHFKFLLQEIFIIPDDLSALLLGSDTGILAEIHRHFVRNPEDADVEWLFEKLQVFDLSEPRFRRWLEGLVSSDVQIDVEAQSVLVTAMNVVLRTCGAEMRHVSDLGGYPVFGLVLLRAARGRPKNIIFASITKPDIRLSNSMENDIEILSSPDDVLVYDKPLGSDGLRWRELQSWWAELKQEEDLLCAKRTLYRRLQQSLPLSSPPQQMLFESYFRSFGPAIHDLPALLPEVWLHWDPKTVSERGAQALLNHRMDFLMLLPAGGRAVIEVDGIQHYSDDMQRANTRKYAQLVAGDRELKLAGYDVYRFGGAELQGEDAPSKIKAFFVALLMRHGIKVN
ncbi:AbiJ-related protein [Serratia sp. IR-2025]